MTKIPQPSDDAWVKLHSFELKFGECWKNCEGYCCKTNNKAQDFALMKKDSAGMVFMPGEYEFLARHHRLQEGFYKTHRHHDFTFNEERGLTLGFDTAVCDLGGICSIPAWRPMICKLYPYYPVPTPETGMVDNFITGSIIDQYWADLGLEHPCWLHRTQGDAVKAAVKKTESSLDHPYFVFYMGAAAIFVDHVTKHCREDQAHLFKGDPRQFFRQWEVLYLMKQLVDKPALCAELTALYDRVEKHYGAFQL